MSGRIIKAILAAATALSVASCSDKKNQIVCGISEISQMGINYVQPTVDAMEKYKKDNGKYPNDVFALVPKYINKIPIILSSDEDVDKTKYNILVHQKIKGGVPKTLDDGISFKIEFMPTDDRVCLAGDRNNVCEYTSEAKQWGCYQH